MEFQRLTDEEVIDLHDLILENSEGLPGISQNKSLSAILTRVENHNYYGNISDIFEIAAHYGIGLAQGHAFVDGNKRTALGSIDQFLELNGYNLEASEEDAVTFIENIAKKNLSLEQVIEFLKLNTRIII